MSRSLRFAALLLLVLCLILPAASHAEHFFTGYVGTPFHEDVLYSRSPETVSAVFTEDAGALPPGLEAVRASSGYILTGIPSHEGISTFTVTCVWSNGVTTIDPVTVSILPASEAPAQPEGTAPTVTKDPTEETVQEGGSCKFIARADDYSDLTWYLTD